ncbi:MAG: efflux RND transporter periplasmic adaptor subunit [Betaproteobacteria bacterium]|nr:efflux RND transporter periplasmic adaptor subunit [Betaproteobacteria bacterium]
MAASRTWRRVVGGLLVVAVVGAVGGGVAWRMQKKSAEAQRAKDVAVALEFAPTDLTRVEGRALARRLPVSGTLQPLKQAVVKAKVSGDVRQIAVREGEAVRAGQVLARIDTADLEARLAERIGTLESSRAQLALAEKTRATNLALLKQNFISRNAFDNSESSYSVSQGTVKSAEAQVQIARNALKDAVVVAPLSGIVARRHVQPGEKVGFDAPLVTVVDLAGLELQALVPAVDVPELAIGMQVELAIDGFGERRFAGRVERINPSTEPGTRAFLVYVGIPNPERTLRGGMFATGHIALAAQAPVPTLPLAAVRVEAGQSYVWSIVDGKLARHSLVTGRRDDEAGRIEIRSELPAGMPILATRFDNLKEGAPALVRTPAAAAPNAG